MSKLDPARLKTFFARASVVANLLHSRLALPLMYPLNTRPNTVSRPDASGDSAGAFAFSEKEHIQCLSQITPVVVGISKIAGILKASDALANYSGGRMRRRYVQQGEPKTKVSHRLHHLRSIEHKGGAIVSRVGLGRGWEKFSQGVPVDSPRRKFKSVMGENEGLDVAKPIRIMGKEIPRSSVEKALYCTGAFLIVFNAFSIPFALPKLRAFLGAPYLPSSSSAFRKVIENVSELQRPGLKLVDIGSGDGRLLVEASRKGMKSMGIEMNPWLVLGSRLRLVLAKANSNSSILWGNAWKSLNPLSRFEPDVVVFYGRTGQGLMSKLGQLSEDISDRTGKDLIVISNKFQIPGWNIRLIAHVDEFFVYRLHSNNRS